MGDPAAWRRRAPSDAAGSSADPNPSGSGGTGGAPGEGGPVVGDNTPGGTVLAAKATLTLRAAVTTVPGTRYAADGTELTNSRAVSSIIDDLQHPPSTPRRRPGP
ncbi:hypothetical protein ABZT02_34945 [Streptomyces sp. NPDC005402]|uniref:hypothetical protein n=1 Tax=Streptomyces sp. NPDC005402 TaxID=3155338 RepID=UPI0033BDF317